MISAFNKFIYRIPFYPLDTIVNNEKHADDTDSYLRHFFSDPAFREAMYTASAEFSKEIDSFLEGQIPQGKRMTKFRNTAVKYIGRMASRPTPFGLFSACGIGVFSDKDAIVPDTANRFTASVRLDMGLLTSFSEFILADKELRKSLIFYTNNTVYKSGNRYRYVEYTVTNGEKLYNLSSFEMNDYIGLLLQKGRDGMLMQDLAGLLADDEVSNEEALEFINELVESKILVSELEPYMTGVEYHSQIYDFLCRQQLNNKMGEQVSTFYKKSKDIFDRINILIDQISRNEKDISSNKYHEIIEIAGSLDLLYPVKHHIQLDSFCNNNVGGATLSQDLLKQIIEGVNVCTRFSTQGLNGTYMDFKRKFSDKYGEQFISLSEALDPETGIGYGNTNNEMLDITPFVDNLPVGHGIESDRGTVQWDNKLHTLLMSKVIEAEKKQVKVVALTTAEVELLKPKVDLLPPTFNAFVSVSYDADQKPWIYYHQVGATSATCLMGRFGFLNPEIENLIKDISNSESEYYKGKIVAEINHLSESRAGNVMLRQRNRQYEICYLTKSNKQEAGKIEVDDLYLGIRDGGLVLYSASLDKEIVPRLSNAHNYYKDTLPVYKFLSDMQEEETNGYLGLVTDVGSIPAMVNFIPRITYKNIIIWPAHWYLKTEEMRRLFELPDDAFKKSMQDYFAEKGIGTCFFLTNREFDLFVDTGNVLSLRAFVNEVKDMPRFSVKECLQVQHSKHLIQNADGFFMHELIVPLKREAPQKAGKTALVSRTDLLQKDNKSLPQRKYFPGDEWVYFKLYTGIKVAEKIVSEKFIGLTELLVEKGLISQWFFLRYTDPDFHIRLRFKLTDRAAYGELVSSFYSYFSDYLQEGSIKKVILDTYDRELERYGFELIDAAEQVFHTDSVFVTELITHAAAAGIKEYKWLLAMGIMESYFNAFEVYDERRLNFVKGIRDVFATEFHAGKMQRRHFSAKYRTEKLVIENFLLEKKLEGYNIEWFFKMKEKLEQSLSVIYKTQYAEQQESKVEAYLNSFIHMSLDRFFSSKNRPHEYALYSLMEQFYRYQIGKSMYTAHEVEI